MLSWPYGTPPLENILLEKKKSSDLQSALGSFPNENELIFEWMRKLTRNV